MDDALIRTRDALQLVAEYVLGGDLWRNTGKIGLRRLPGGFGQPEHVVDGTRRRLRVDGHHLVVLDGDAERWNELTTLDAAAAFAHTSVAAPDGVYRVETTADGSARLDIDHDAARRLSDWFELVEQALEVVRRRHADRHPTIVQLWLEHFDLACSLAEVNLGGSPGDDAHPEPYLYVGPWSPRSGDFWNEAWGASKGWTDVSGVDDAVGFFDEGLRRALDG